MEVPNDYKTAGIFMTIAGALNAMMSMVWIFALIWVCIGVFWVVPLVLAVAELIVGIMVLQGKPMPAAKIVSILGIVTGVLCFNPLPIILEILATVWLRKPEVEGYLTMSA